MTITEVRVVCRSPFLFLLPLLLLSGWSPVTHARDWYSAGHGQVAMQAFVVQVPEAELRTLLPAPLTLSETFAGRAADKHPLVFLFSRATPKKAHFSPILIDMSYDEFAVFIPGVRHPDLKGEFIHSVVLYLNSHLAVWMGKYPYRFPKTRTTIDRSTGARYGHFNVVVEKKNLVTLEYEVTGQPPIEDVQPLLRQLDDWFSLPLINGSRKFTCARMDWEIVNHGAIARISGRLGWQDRWLADTRRLTAPAASLPGLQLETLWYLSMPLDCDRFRAR